MNLYKLHNTNRFDYILHFGLGLIGQAVLDELIKHVLISDRMSLTWSWSEQAIQEQAFKKIEEFTKSNSKVAVIWTAGKVGFSATESDIALEFATFKSVVDQIEKLASQKFWDTSCIFFSSAGGLFEGRSAVSKQSPLSIKRPYGTLKRNQEEYLQAKSFVNKKLLILRPSTVYSKNPRLSFRQGLINVLVKNAKLGRVTTLFGNQNTLRDYVSGEDLGNYVVKCLIENSSRDFEGTRFLVSGKATSIYEIVDMTQRVLGRNIYVQYSLDKHNSSPITFSKQAMAANFYPTDLKTNLAFMLRD